MSSAGEHPTINNILEKGELDMNACIGSLPGREELSVSLTTKS